MDSQCFILVFFAFVAYIFLRFWFGCMDTNEYVGRGKFHARIIDYNENKNLTIWYDIPTPHSNCYYLVRLYYNNGILQPVDLNYVSGDVGLSVAKGSPPYKMTWKKYKQGVIRVNEIMIEVCEITPLSKVYKKARKRYFLQVIREKMPIVNVFYGSEKMKELDDILWEYFSK